MSDPTCKCGQLTRHWSVTVERNSETILTIESNHLSGRDLSEADEQTIRDCAEHLLSFVGSARRTWEARPTEDAVTDEQHVEEAARALQDALRPVIEGEAFQRAVMAQHLRAAFVRGMKTQAALLEGGRRDQRWRCPACGHVWGAYEDNCHCGGEPCHNKDACSRPLTLADLGKGEHDGAGGTRWPCGCFIPWGDNLHRCKKHRELGL